MVNTRKITKLAAFISVAVILGYVESLFPPVAAGVKLGIANTVIIAALYIHGGKDAYIVSVLKVVLCMALFGSMTSFIYSLSGAVLSLSAMIIAKRSKNFSIISVSGLGGLCHNIAQFVCAYIIIGKGVLFYLPVLCLSGILCGVLTGIAAQLIVKRGREIFGKE
ncbi:MAG: Gx transporter family protein [Clostridia bacterium]|nr:Gx transporter family protein [Clostridia bacterium]